MFLESDVNAACVLHEGRNLQCLCEGHNFIAIRSTTKFSRSAKQEGTVVVKGGFLSD